MVFYFAYGSNLSTKQMKHRCPDSKVLGVGVLKGYRIDFNFYSSRRNGGVADIIEDKDGKVWGLVYELTSGDLESLDGFEDYPSTYSRFKVSIECDDEIFENVWAYSIVKKGETIKPSRQYLGLIIGGGKEFGFPDGYLKSLECFLDCPIISNN